MWLKPNESLCPGTVGGRTIGDAPARHAPTPTSSVSDALLPGRPVQGSDALPSPFAASDAAEVMAARIAELEAQTAAMSARNAKLEAQIEIVRAAVGSAAHPSSGPSPTTPLPEPEEGVVDGGRRDDGQLQVGDTGRSTFYGSGATHFLIVGAPVAGLTAGAGNAEGDGHAGCGAVPGAGGASRGRAGTDPPAAGWRALAAHLL